MDENETWHILKIKSKKEKTVANLLNKIGFETLMPEYISLRKWSDRIKKVKVPLFSNLLFVKTTEANRNDVFVSPYILGYLCVAKKIAKLQNTEVINLKQLCASENEVELTNNNLLPGDSVIINKGSYIGLKGKILKQHNSEYLIVDFPTLTFFAKIKISKKDLIKC